MGQHYVPQHYLRQFATTRDPGKIWVYDKYSGDCKFLPIRNVAQSRDFYKEADERTLNEKIERPAQGPLEQLRCGQHVDFQGRASIACYLESMIKRVPHTRKKMLKVVRPVTENMIERIRKDYEAEASRRGATPEELLEALDEFQQDFRTRDISMKDDTVRFQWFSPEIAKHIFSMKWKVIRTDSRNRFLTGDNPVFFHEGYGLKHPRAELSFAIASDVALHGSWQETRVSDLMFVDGRPAIVKELNRRVVRGAVRFVFYHQKAAWVRQLAKKPRLQLSHIRW